MIDTFKDVVAMVKDEKYHLNVINTIHYNAPRTNKEINNLSIRKNCTVVTPKRNFHQFTLIKIVKYFSFLQLSTCSRFYTKIFILEIMWTKNVG